MQYGILVLRILVMTVCCLAAGVGRADCLDAGIQLQRLKTEPQQLHTTQQSFVAIRQGSIPADFQRSHLFPFALDDMTSRRAYAVTLGYQSAGGAVEPVECEKLSEEIVGIQRQLILLRQEVASIRKQWLDLPSNQLVALESLFHHWHASSIWVTTLQSTDVAADTASLRQLTLQWQQLSGRLAQRLSRGPVTVAAADPLWREILAMPDELVSVPAEADKQLLNVADEIESAVHVLKTIAVFYHNLALNNDGLNTLLEQPDHRFKKPAIGIADSIIFPGYIGRQCDHRALPFNVA